MQYKTLYNGDPIPVMGQGTWGIGGFMSPDYSKDEAGVEAIRTAIELGYTHIDTAEMYGRGHTEELVGQAIRDFNREELFICSKVWHVTQNYEDTLKALEGSLKRLTTDYLDLYLIHRPNYDIPLEETFRALNRLVKEGKVRHLGVSNFNLAQLQHARDLADIPLATNQVPYNLHNRLYQRNGVLDYCREHNMLLTAYSPIDRGHLANDSTLQRLAALCGATPAQIALYWLVRQPGVIALPMSSRREHLQENLGALELKLSRDDIHTLDHLELPEENLWPE